MKVEKLKINIEKLPMIIELDINGYKKEYIVKLNKEKSGIFLNIKEQY